MFYLDETGFSNIPNIQYGWSPAGQPHLIDASAPRKRANVIGAMSWPDQALHYQLLTHSTKREHIVEFLNVLAKKCDSSMPNIVVMDNATIHHNFDREDLIRWAAIHNMFIVYLPPYSPELNPIEILWKHIKYHWRPCITWAKDALVENIAAILDAVGTKFQIRFR